MEKFPSIRKDYWKEVFYKKTGIDFYKVYALVARLETIRIVNQQHHTEDGRYISWM